MTAPEGYTAAAVAGGHNTPTELTCDRCGATVAPRTAERHTAWHEEVLTKEGLIGVLSIDRAKEGGQLVEVLTKVVTNLGHDAADPAVRSVMMGALQELLDQG